MYRLNNHKTGANKMNHDNCQNCDKYNYCQFLINFYLILYNRNLSISAACLKKHVDCNDFLSLLEV